jgi:PPK2 family polyphosphate:nucleotide phosphotransferase
MLSEEVINDLRVPVDTRVHLDKYETGWAQTKVLKKLGKDKAKEEAAEILRKSVEELIKEQDVFQADDTYSLLMILQAMDTAGKDGTIKHVMSGLNPQGCEVTSFKKPTSEELDHTFLWRYTKALPERGRIGIFNRSYYEDVLVPKVHPEVLAEQKLPKGKRKRSFWKGRYEDINALERHLVRNGTVILKFFLHLSKHEQKLRLLERLNNPEKRWKFSVDDVSERAHWDQYMAAYEDALSATSTEWAPWYVIPADQKWVTRALVANILCTTVHGLELRYPEVSPEKEAILAQARQLLESEA